MKLIYYKTPAGICARELPPPGFGAVYNKPMVSLERGMATESIAPTPPSPPFPYRGALFALVVGTIGALSAIYCTQPILPELSADFHVDAPTAGLTLSLMTAALAVSLLIYGPLSDRVGRRPVLIGCCLGMAVPALGAMLAPTFSWLLLCRLGQGVLAGGISAVALAYIADEFPRARIGQ